MLWWLIGLWLLNPAILPILWLLGMLREHLKKSPGTPHEADPRQRTPRHYRPSPIADGPILLPRMSAPADERAKYEPCRDHTNAEPNDQSKHEPRQDIARQPLTGKGTARITVTHTPIWPEPGEASQPRGGTTALSECAVDRNSGNTETLRDRRATQCRPQLPDLRRVIAPQHHQTPLLPGTSEQICRSVVDAAFKCSQRGVALGGGEAVSVTRYPPECSTPPVSMRLSCSSKARSPSRPNPHVRP